MWRYVRWAPAALAVLLFVLASALGGSVESVILGGLILIQVIVLVVPLLARYAGRAIGD